MQGWLLAAILTLAMGGAGYWYFTYSQDKITELSNQNIELVHHNERQELTIIQLQKRAVELFEARQKLEKDLRASTAYEDRLERVLRSHDLTALAKAKPGLIEKRINDGTQKVFDDLESTTNE